MLRTIISVTGVVLIGLGLFGGQLLGNIAAQFTDQPEQAVASVVPGTVQPGSLVQDDVVSNTVVIKEASADAAVVSPTTDTSAAVATAESTIVKPVVEPVVEPVTQPVAAEITTKVPVIKESQGTVVASAADASVVETKAAAAKVIDETQVAVAEPMAPAQAAGDLIAMAEQAKSSSRNEQVNLAKTILASSKKLVEETAVIAKESEVDSVMVATTGALENEMLIVIKDKVNLRDGPSIDHPVVLQLEQGQELMEFKREGRWVHVGAYGTSGKIGWVHQRLVGPVAK